jgi:hypothetical protein
VTTASVNSGVAHVVWVLAYLWAGLALAMSLTFPIDAQPYTELDDKGLQRKDCVEASLGVEGRRRLMLLCLLYNCERSFTISAIESATALILELEYGYGPPAVGFSIGMVFLTTVVLGVVLIGIAHKQLLPDSALMQALTFMACFGALSFFDFGNRHGHSPALWMMAADTIVYTCGYQVNGFLDGVGCRAEVPGTYFSLENYQVARTSLAVLVRAFAPPIARAIAWHYGRNAYAGVQFAIVVCGALTVRKAFAVLNGKDTEGGTNIFGFQNSDTVGQR